VPNKEEQKLIKEMRAMRDSGSSLLAIHRWLNEEKDIKLAYSSMRLAISIS
jgi:hypothetical protein